MKNHPFTFSAWSNHVGIFCAHPITGAHYGPFLTVSEAREWHNSATDEKAEIQPINAKEDHSQE